MTSFYFSLCKDKHIKKNKCRNSSELYSRLTYRSPHRPHFHCCFGYDDRLTTSHLRPSQKRLQARRLLGFSTMDSAARSSWGRAPLPYLTEGETHAAVTHHSLGNGVPFFFFLVVVSISTALFPAGGEASNVKEHAGLFFHVCWGNASTFSLGKM